MDKISRGRVVHVLHAGAGPDGRPDWVAGIVSDVVDDEKQTAKVHLFLPSGGVVQVTATKAIADTGTNHQPLDSWMWPPRA